MSAVDRAGRSDLHYAAVECDLDRVSELLSGGADPNFTDSQGFTALHFVAQKYCPEVVQLLLDHGGDPNAQEHPFGKTPLAIAVLSFQGSGEVVQALLSAGANPDIENHHGNSPRSIAETIADYDVAQYFASS